MAFNPTLEGGIGFEQPVQQPNLASGIASLVNTFAGAVPTPRQPSAAELKEQRTQALNSSFLDNLNRAQALREQGNERAAVRLERQAQVQYAFSGGDLGSADVQAGIRAFTGKDADELGFSEQELMFQRIKEEPEYQAMYVGSFATNPDISDQERENLAMTRYSRMQANKVIIEETRTDWVAGQGQAARISVIQDWRQTNMGILSLAGQGGSDIGQQEVQEAMVNFSNLESEIIASRPQGIKAEEWAPVQNAIESTRTQLQLLERFTSNENISAQMAQELIKGIEALPDATLAEKNIMVQAIMKDPQLFRELGFVNTGDLADMFVAASEIDTADNAASIEAGNGNADLVDDMGSQTFTRAELEKATKTTPEESFSRASNLARGAGGIKNVINDQESMEQWLGLMFSGTASLYAMASTQDAWASAEGYRKFFNQGFFQNMDALRNSGATFTYEALRNKANEAIDANIAALRANVQSQNRSQIIKYDPTTDTISVDKDSFKKLNIPPNLKDQAYNVLVNNFGGDIDKFLSSPAQVGKYLPGGAMLVNRLNTELNWKGTQERLKAIRQLKAFKGRLPSSETVEGGAGEAETPGSQGEDMLGAEALVSLIDRTEGGGDYDTLFGFSNREGKAFEGFKVSEMTLGELSQFSQGEYADWSKEQLGYVATPMGKYQIVGATLRQTAKEMGLPNNIVFTEEVQDAMFHHIAKKTLSGKKTVEAKRKAMRATWEGFKRVSDEELDSAIAQFEGTEAPALADLQSRDSNTLKAVRTSARPLSRVDISTPESVSSTAQAPTPTKEPTRASDGSPTASQSGPKETSEAQRTAAKREWSQLEDQTKKLLIRLFGNEEGVIEALASGTLDKEDI
jgi:hypothetical protein